MLEELEIHNLGPIRSALIAPAGGMTAITGETGAGKSMLLSAIRLISGGPSDGGRVSVGAQEAWAQGVFEVASSSAAVAAAREAGFEPEDGELFLSRKVPASGRSRSMLSGRSVPRSVLASVAAELVTIHGQADQLRIATVSRQREFLDRYAGDEVALAAYGKTWNALRAMDERLERLSSQESSMRQQADYLRESIERINRVDPQPGEMDELRARRDRIENAAEIAEGVTRALGALDASQVTDDVESASAADLIDRASQALRAIHVEGVFSELADRLDSISTDLSDVVFSLSGEVDNEASVEDLDAINGRIHELDELTRRWGPELSDGITWRDKAVYDLEDLDASPEKVEQLEAERAQLLEAAKKAAQAVSKRRRAAAKELASKVTAELDSLAMGTSKLEIRVAEREQLDVTGADDIEFLFTPFPGSPQLPMGKSASGGELSRLMLALELVAAEKHVVAGGTVPPMTFIFDEVDAGVGGKAAVELGARLAKLAQSAQVLVVTHLPQVASWADEQYVVAKGETDDGSIATTINQVRGEARVHEIARMLSGSESETSLEHAEELLKSSVLD
ncbi:DNA repair protein RecN [Bifidobacterium sp.]|uniref:DNA repair protein RecN n=1 Tax=Bifidobacterium sp. TaxID=41200 RepID=UPI0025810040|nr:DNA repair protein RecN [Bifidobacterium sp.]